MSIGVKNVSFVRLSDARISNAWIGVKSIVLEAAQPATISPYISGVTPSSLPVWRAALANVRAGTGKAILGLPGDSTSMGYGANPTSNLMRPNATQSQLATLQGTYGAGNVLKSSVFGTGGEGAVFSAYDNRVTGTGSNGTLPGLGGSLYALTAGQEFHYNLGGQINSVDIYYLEYPCSFTIAIDGGAPIETFSVSGSSFILKKHTVTFPLGTHVIDIVHVSGIVEIQGVACYNSASSDVQIYNFGIAAHTSASWASSVDPLSPYRQAVEVAPHLMILNIGINDAYYYDTSYIPTTIANIQSSVDGWAAAGIDTVVVIPTPNDIPDFPDFFDAIRSWCVSHPVPYIDIYALGGSLSDWITRGEMYDTVHPNGLGYARIAEYYQSVFTV